MLVNCEDGRELLRGSMLNFVGGSRSLAFWTTFPLYPLPCAAIVPGAFSDVTLF